MNHSIRKTALAAAVALPATLGVQTASAALITEWSYQIDSAFTNWTQTSGTGSVTGSDNNTDVFNAPSKLSWGEPSNPEGDQSSIGIESDVDGSGLLTKNDVLGLPGNSVDGATFTHDNNVILASSADLDTFRLSTQLQLAQEAPPGSAEETVGPIIFNGNFSETRNLGSAEDCFVGSTTACDDIFVLGNAGDLDALGTGQSFVVDDYRYTVFLDLAGVGPLTDEQCTVAGADLGCVGFLTEEDNLNQFFSTVRIEATQIPAPGVLALLGVGLLGLGCAHRGRRS